MSNQEDDDSDVGMTFAESREVFLPILEAAYSKRGTIRWQSRSSDRLVRFFRSQNITTLEGLGTLNWRALEANNDFGICPPVLFRSFEYIGREGASKFADLVEKSKKQPYAWLDYQLKLAREQFDLKRKKPSCVRCVVTTKPQRYDALPYDKSRVPEKYSRDVLEEFLPFIRASDYGSDDGSDNLSDDGSDILSEDGSGILSQYRLDSLSRKACIEKWIDHECNSKCNSASCLFMFLNYIFGWNITTLKGLEVLDSVHLSRGWGKKTRQICNFIHQNGLDAFVRLIYPSTTELQRAEISQIKASLGEPKAIRGVIHIDSLAQARACWNNHMMLDAEALMLDSSLHEPWLNNGVLDIFATYPILVAEYHKLSKIHPENHPVFFFIMCGFSRDVVHYIRRIFNFDCHPRNGKAAASSWHNCVINMMDMAYELNTKIPVSRLRSFLRWDFLRHERVLGFSSEALGQIIERYIFYNYEASLVEEFAKVAGKDIEQLALWKPTTFETDLPLTFMLTRQHSLLIEKFLPRLKCLKFHRKLNFELAGFLHMLEALSQPGNVERLEELHLVIPHFQNQDESEKVRIVLRRFIETKSSTLQNLKLDGKFVSHGSYEDFDSHSSYENYQLRLVHELMAFVATKSRIRDGPYGSSPSHGWSLRTLALGKHVGIEADDLKNLVACNNIRRISVCGPCQYLGSDGKLCKDEFPVDNFNCSRRYDLPKRKQQCCGFAIDHLIIEDRQMVQDIDLLWSPASNLEHLFWTLLRGVPRVNAVDAIAGLPRLKSLSLVPASCLNLRKKVDVTPCLVSLLTNAPIEVISIDDIQPRGIDCEIQAEILCNALRRNSTLQRLLLCRVDIKGAKETIPDFLLWLLDTPEYNNTTLGHAQLYDDQNYFTPLSRLDIFAWRTILDKKKRKKYWGLEPPRPIQFEQTTKLQYLLHLNQFGRSKVRQKETTTNELVRLLSDKPRLDLSQECDEEEAFCRDIVRMTSDSTWEASGNPSELCGLTALYEMLLQETTREFWIFILQRDLDWFGVQNGLLLESPLVWANSFQQCTTRMIAD